MLLSRAGEGRRGRTYSFPCSASARPLASYRLYPARPRPPAPLAATVAASSRTMSPRAWRVFRRSPETPSAPAAPGLRWRVSSRRVELAGRTSTFSWIGGISIAAIEGALCRRWRVWSYEDGGLVWFAAVAAVAVVDIKFLGVPENKAVCGRVFEAERAAAAPAK